MDEDEARAFRDSPLFASQVLVHTLLEDKSINYQAVNEAWKVIRRNVCLSNIIFDSSPTNDWGCAKWGQRIGRQSLKVGWYVRVCVWLVQVSDMICWHVQLIVLLACVRVSL